MCPIIQLSRPLWFFFFFFIPRCGVKTQQSSGTAKECSLHSCRVNGWMHGVIKEWTNGQVWFKMPVSWGPEQELDILSNHCFFFFLVLGFRNIQGRVFIKENPADMKTVRYCFVTFYLNFRFSLHFVLLLSHFRAVGTTQSPFFFWCVFLFSSQRSGEGSNKHDDVQKNANASIKNLHHALGLF